MIWTVCKVFGKTPKELDNEFGGEGILWEWALTNIRKDEEDKWRSVKDVFSALKPWLNYDLWKANSTKPDTQSQDINTTFLDELKKSGASTEEIDKLIQGIPETVPLVKKEEEDAGPGITLIED